MIKLLGACFVLIATSWIGFEIARSFRERPRQIRQLRSALSLLETEIGYGVRPLEQACREIAKREHDVIADLFAESARNLGGMDGASTHECFQTAMEQRWKYTAMKRAEKTIFGDFTSTLGVSDRDNQLHHLAIAKTNLEVEEQKAREEQVQYEKMYKTMGVLTGALIVILMY